MNIATRLRDAIRSSDQSLSAIGRESGVPQPMLTVFMQGADMRVKTADKLAAYFGLELTSTNGRAKKKKPTKGTVG